MKKIEKYLMVTVLQSILLVLALIMILEIFILFVSQMGHIGRGHFTIWVVFQYVFYRVPYELLTCFPVICLLGCLIGLSSLANHSELVILRVSGLSILNIFRIVSFAGFAFIFVSMILAEYSVPKLMFMANNLRMEALNRGHLLREAESVWFRNEDNFWYIGHVQDARHLQDVSLFQKNAEGVLSSIVYFKNVDREDNHWKATHVEKTIFHEHRVERQLTDEQAQLKLPLDPIFFKNIVQAADEMSLFSLWHRINQLHKQHNVAKEELIFWQRLMQPLNTLLMMLLAIPCIFGPLRSSTMGAKLISGIVLGFGFYLINQMFGFVSQVYQIKPILGATMPFMLFLVFGLILLNRSH